MTVLSDVVLLGKTLQTDTTINGESSTTMGSTPGDSEDEVWHHALADGPADGSTQRFVDIEDNSERIEHLALCSSEWKGPLFCQESHFLKRKVSDSCHRSFNSTLFLSGTYVFSGGHICKTLVL